MDKKENLTKEQLIEKINSERQVFKQALLHRDEQKLRAIATVRKLADVVLARVIRSYGHQDPETGEYVLDIPKPEGPTDTSFWVTKVEQPDPETYRLKAKKVDLTIK